MKNNRSFFAGFLVLSCVWVTTVLSAQEYVYDQFDTVQNDAPSVYDRYERWGQDEPSDSSHASRLIAACIAQAKSSWVLFLADKKLEDYTKDEFQDLINQAYSNLKADCAIALSLYLKKYATAHRGQARAQFFDLLRDQMKKAAETGRAMVEFLRDKERIYLTQRKKLEERRLRYQEIETKKLVEKSTGLEREVLLYEDEFKQLRAQEEELEAQLQEAIGRVRGEGAFFMYRPSAGSQDAELIAQTAKKRLSNFRQRIEPFFDGDFDDLVS